MSGLAKQGVLNLPTFFLGCGQHKEKRGDALFKDPPCQVGRSTNSHETFFRFHFVGFRGSFCSRARQPEPKKSMHLVTVATPSPRPSPKGRGRILNVVIHRELERVRPQAQRLNLAFTLVFDPAIDHALREHITLEQEFVIILQRV